MASFFILFFSFQCSSSIAAVLSGEVVSEVDSDPLWHAILQLKHSKPINPNHSAYIHKPFVNAGHEAVSTIALFTEQKESICRYPARFRYLKQFVSSLSNLDLSNECPEYEQFKRKVPADSMHLVYASENVTSASSMMGHIMLRLDGVNDQELSVQHGITFFTELDSLNVPKIMYETLISGKEGVFQVAPYGEFENHYRSVEQRNIWEYELNVKPDQKAYIQDVIWELGQNSPDYFFHTYNCATVTQLLLALTRPSELNSVDDWLTPLDVVKFAVNNKLVKNTQVLPSNKWMIYALREQIPVQKSSRIAASITSGSFSKIEQQRDNFNFIDIQYARALNEFLVSNGRLNKAEYENNKTNIQRASEYFSNLALDVSSYKKPTELTEEAFISTNLMRFANQNYLGFRLFPVARRISDDNRNLMGETQLILSDIAFRIGLDKENQGDVYLDRAMLYQMTSRVPFTQHINDLSSTFNIGLKRVLSNDLTLELVAETTLGLGITKELTKDLGFYADFILGAGADKEEQYLFAKPAIGMYLYSVFDTKLSLHADRTYNQYNNSDYIDSLSLLVSHYISKRWVTEFSAKTSRLNGHQVDELMLSLGYRF